MTIHLSRQQKNWVGGFKKLQLGSGYGSDKDPMSLLRDVIGKIRDHPYITSAKGLSGWVGSKNCSWVRANYGGDEDPMALLPDVIGKIRDHSHITSAIMTDGVGGWFQKR